MKQTLAQIAELLDTAASTAKAVDQISKTTPITLQESYEIQALSIDKRLGRGEKMTGYKLGFTSKAKMEQMGVHDVIWGRLTDQMEITDDGISVEKGIHPRIEPEIAFRVKKTIDRLITNENVLEYIDGIAGALEMIDSRYENFKFSLEDVIADNCSSSGYLIGPWHSADTQSNYVAINLIINGETVQTGSSHAILGNPLESIAEASKMMVKYNHSIPAGSIILAGAATSAVYLKSGDQIEGTFGHLGSVTTHVK